MATQKQIVAFDAAQNGELKSGVWGTVTVLPHRVVALHEAAANVGAARKMLHKLAGGGGGTGVEQEKAGVLGELLMHYALDAAGIEHTEPTLVVLTPGAGADISAGGMPIEIKTTDARGRRAGNALVNEAQRAAGRQGGMYAFVMITADDSAVIVLRTAAEVAAWPLFDGTAASGPGSNACYAARPARACRWDELLSADDCMAEAA